MEILIRYGYLPEQFEVWQLELWEYQELCKTELNIIV